MGQVQSFDGVSCVLCGDIFLVLWKAPSRIERTHWLADRLADAVAASPGGIVLAQLILPTSSPPDRPAREHARESLLSHGDRIRHLISLPLGDTFWTNVVRAIMRTMTLFTRHRHEIASDEGDALRRIRAIATDRTPVTQTLVDAIDGLYRALDVPRLPARQSAAASS